MKHLLLRLVLLSLLLSSASLHATASPISGATDGPPLATPTISAEAAGDLRDEATLIDRYAQADFEPVRTSDLQGQKGFATRRAAVTVLRSYTELIHAVAAAQSSEDVSQRAQTLKQSMDTLRSAAASSFAATAASNGQLQPGMSLPTTLNPQQVQFVVQGLNVAMRSLNHRKTRKLVAPLVEKADPAIQKLCTLLEADLTDITIHVASDGQFAAMERSRLSPGTHLLKLVSLDQGSNSSLEGIRQANSALKKFASQHQKLAEGETI